MMGRTLKEEIKITQYNNPTKVGKYSLEVLFRASDNIPHHYPKLIQFPPEMDENWVRYGLAKLGQISRTKLAEDAVLCVHNTASALNR